jgi:hypothetical protein
VFHTALWGGLAQAQAEGQAAKAREAAFQLALQELTLFKSRTSAALLQVRRKGPQFELQCLQPQTQI